jgi:GNAT superfamily N-acetyltransferase
VTVGTTPPTGPLAELPQPEVRRRVAEGHLPFLLLVDGELAAYGWAATGAAHIGGLDLAFTVPPGERYLWDFLTLPHYRGRGLYPLLLQEILRRQMAEAEWFWIGHEPTNLASRRGILKAGFRLVGHVRRLRDGELAFAGAAAGDPDVARRAARVLGLRPIPT